jgi:radical SAM superfamily enzyme YgiQ (UPF0313 family)
MRGKGQELEARSLAAFSAVNILLISTYELGRQPFGLASPAAWLRQAGHEVVCQDLAQDKLKPELVRLADLVCFYLPMHTATRIALRVMDQVRVLNPQARIGCYGLYAPMNADLLRAHGAEFVVGGEFEAALLRFAVAGSQSTVNTGRSSAARHADWVSLERLQFYVPDGSTRLAGYAEASRGCKHRCRHCPVVPVYDGVFRVVQPQVVLADIRQQVEHGAGHITFGDPDFFNGPRHAMEIVRALHREFPEVSYDVTIKVEHLLQHADLLPELRATGCAFVTTAVETLDDDVLRLLEKGHTRADFYRLVPLMRAAGLPLSPTFIPFTPWTTLESYADLLRAIAELELVDNVAPVQLSIRLLIPSGSRLLEVPEVQAHLEGFHAEALSYHWHNPDPAVDELQRAVEREVAATAKKGLTRAQTFARVWRLANSQSPSAALPAGAAGNTLLSRAAIPYLTEPWYC